MNRIKQEIREIIRYHCLDILSTANISSMNREIMEVIESELPNIIDQETKKSNNITHTTMNITIQSFIDDGYLIEELDKNSGNWFHVWNSDNPTTTKENTYNYYIRSASQYLKLPYNEILEILCERCFDGIKTGLSYGTTGIIRATRNSEN